MGYLDHAGLQYLWDKLKEKFAPKSHSHDDRYYTEAEMDGKLNGKVNNNEAGANELFSKLTTSWGATPTDDTYFIRQDTGGANQFGRVKFSTIWAYIRGKTDGIYQPKGSYAASEHTHDDRYYTEAEVDGKLSGKSNTGHTHNYAGSSSAGGAANSANKLNTNAGSATQGVYFKDGVPVAMTYTLGKSVPADAKFTDTNTWRGIQNNLTSTATDQSLSANQGKVLKGLVDGKANASHTHDDRYYTESEMNTKLNGKANSSHTHNYAGSSSAGGTANSVNGLTFAAQTTDPGAGSSLATNKVLIVYQ